VVCITDENLLKNYSAELEPWQKVVLGTGEKIKTLKTVHQIYEKLISYEVDRSSFIVAVGGGIVCDVAGFAASTFMRGIPFGFVSTSLLSQVDASAGGKNGVNFEGFKNMIGVFNQPEFVICDYSMLETLPLKEFISGFAEIVKHAAIADAEMFAYLEKNYQRALAHDPEAIHYLIKKSVTIKSSVVEADEREKGERKKLNFGHTFAHSLEKLTGMIHGEAVSIGMVLAARLSEKKDMLSPADVQRLQSLLANLQLPVKPLRVLKHCLMP
jgi:3-dehydroquinate synthase